MELYRKYINWVVIILLFLFCLKSCKSCSLERKLEWNNKVYLQEIESRDIKIDSLNEFIKKQNDSITLLNYSIYNKNEETKRLNDINNHLKNTNKGLIETTKNLSNKYE